jgi:eukaryotic-like serine/threonine-protein kinase
MIAPGGHCQRDRLVRLLHSQLSMTDESAMATHLDHCESCRVELNRLAGSVALWQETREVLSDSAELSQTPDSNRTGVASNASPSLSASWVTSLLRPSEDPGLLGMLDNLPVQSVIGQGGMGVVLRAWDEQLHRPLAVKLLSPMLASTGAARQRFFREAQAVASVVHPNIVPIYSIHSDGSLPYIVMPLIGGGSLQQRIERVGPLTVIEVLTIGLQIAEALRAAHGQGLVHRDIKPANILLDEGGHRVMLSDFGLARALDDASMTASGMIAGTPNYMSPEQARGESVDARSDLYSLGAVMYTMATGHPPARGDSPLAVLRKVIDDAPRVIHEVNESMPVWLDRLIQRFLVKSIDRRIATADEAAELLRGCLSHLRAPARISLPSEIRPHRSLWATGRAVLAISIIVLAGYATALVFIPPTTPANTNAIYQPNDALGTSTHLEEVNSTTSGWLQDLDAVQLDDQLHQANQTLDRLQKSLETSMAF